ncbi:uncharacterized protein [Typha angustifolia]|uniref:uncharacterized protein n=1 Tax=Typha angustifolia TaxID=59011 RepID=UPI003C2C25EE
MDFWPVFYALQDVFPQIDLLILKSIAIDYSSDVDAAVEFVLNEVLESISESTETDVVPHNIHHAKHSPSGSGMHEQQNILGDQRSEEDPNLLLESSISCQNGICSDDSTATDVGSLCMHKAVGRSGLVEDTSALNKPEFFYGNSDLLFESKDLGCEPDLFAGHMANVFHSEPISFSELSTSSSFSDLPNQEGVSNEKAKSVAELVDHIVQPHQKLRDSAAPHVGDNIIEAEIRRNVSEFCSHIQEFSSSTPEINLYKQYGTGAGKHMNGCYREIEDQPSTNLLNAENAGQLCNIEADESTLDAFISAENISLPIVENLSHSGKHEAREERTISNSISTTGQEQSGCLTESTAEHVASQMKMSSIGDDHHTLGLATQSSQVVQVDYIDEFIYNMTKRKETLTSAFESTSAKMEQVELHEANVREIKQEVAKADQGILSKVKDLGKMIENAKESNNKHAGEVYKERSLLEIEARELQSQLINISSQRDNSLSIIKEINHTLDARLSTAKEEKAAVEQEIVEKRKQAYKVLKQREEEVEHLKQVSTRLQIEIEENVKLRNLLMDRGRIVDILQGEMSVICENITSLKERFSGHLPLNKLTPPTTSWTSSTCSFYTKDLLSHGDLHVSSDENPILINKESSQDQMLESNVDNHKALSDDDWDYIDA